MADREANIESLIGMGFTRERAELGLNKTQNRDLQSALDWYGFNIFIMFCGIFDEINSESFRKRPKIQIIRQIC